MKTLKIAPLALSLIALNSFGMQGKLMVTQYGNTIFAQKYYPQTGNYHEWEISHNPTTNTYSGTFEMEDLHKGTKTDPVPLDQKTAQKFYKKFEKELEVKVKKV